MNMKDNNIVCPRCQNVNIRWKFGKKGTGELKTMDQHIATTLKIHFASVFTVEKKHKTSSFEHQEHISSLDSLEINEDSI